MPSADQIKPDGKFMGLFIGRSGSGKSAAAYSFPHDENGIMKILDLDGRIRGGLVPWINRKFIDFQQFPPKPETGTTFDALNEYYASLQVLLKVGQARVKTIVQDSATWTADNLLLDALPLTHKKNDTGGDSGRKLGSMNMAGPSDYGFQSTGMLQMVAFLRSLNVPNVIVTAHTVQRWGRLKDVNGKVIDPYGPTQVVGESLALTDKLAEKLPSSFDNVFRFEKEDTNSAVRFLVSCDGELARNTFGIPYGNYDITGKDFYKWLMEEGWKKR